MTSYAEIPCRLLRSLTRERLRARQMMRMSQMMRTSEKNAIQPILLGNKLTATKVVAPLGGWISNDLPGLLFKPAVGPLWACIPL
ncbi:unnamed protein product [Boreogadus saida]